MDRLPSHSVSHTIRDNPVIGKVSATDHIACSRSGNHRKMHSIPVGFRSGCKKGLRIGVRHELRAGLGITVRVIPIQLFLLTECMLRYIIIFINLIGSNIDNALHHKVPGGTASADTLQEIYRPHHVGFIGFPRILIRVSYNRLRRKMKYDIRS